MPWTLFLPPSDWNEIHLLASQDFNGFNAGMAIFRVHEWSVQMLAETVALRQLRPEVHLDHFDQGALRWVFEKEGYIEHVLYQPHNWWNSFGLNRLPHETDAFTLHFAGVDCCGQEESKGTVMGRWLDILENDPQHYAVELEKTKLPKEVEEYWALLKHAKKTMKDATMAEENPPQLQTATAELWGTYALHADNATAVSIAIKQVEDVMAQVGIESGKPSQPWVNPDEQAVKDAEVKKNAEDKAKQEAQAKKEEEAGKKEEKPAEKEAASGEKEEKPKKEENSTKKEEKPNKEEVSTKKEEASAKEKIVAEAKRRRKSKSRQKSKTKQ